MIDKIVRALTSKPRRTVAIILLGLMILIYFRWLNFDIFTYGDWNYKFIQTLRESTMPFAWVGDIGFGSFNEFIWRMPLDVLFGLFSLIGAGLHISDKFLIFWPLALTTVIAPYVFVYELTQRRIAALAATLFYATNTYFLAINSQGHQLLPLAFNFLTIAFAVFIRALRSGNMLHFLVTAVLLFIAGFIDFRVFYIGIFLLSAYALFFWPRTRDKAFRVSLRKKVLLFYAIAIGLQFYWLFAFAQNYGAESSEVLARSLFGNSYWDLASVMTLHHPFWDGFSTTWFVKNEVPFYFWLVPILAFSTLLLKPRYKYVTFFAVTAIIGILLGKQVSEPFREIYTLLFEYFPGFSAFREATKFYYLTLLGYSVLLGYIVMKVVDSRPKAFVKKIGRGLLIAVFAGLCLVNAWPYISGSMERLLSPRSLPPDYALLEKQLETKDQSYSRTLWVPASSRWSYYSQNHPRLNATSLLSTKLDNPGDKRDVPTQHDLLALLNSETFSHYLSLSAIKYVIVPLRDIDNQNDFFSFYGDSRQPYIDALDSLPFLRKVEDTYQELAVYEFRNPKPYATAYSSLYDLPDETQFAGAFPLLSDALGNTNGTYGFSNENSLPKQSFTDVFANRRAHEFTQAGIPIKSADKPIEFFFNTNRRHYSYIIKDGAITVYQQSSVFMPQATDTFAIQKTAAQKVAHAPIESAKSYYLRYEGGIAPIDTDQTERNLGYLQGDVKLYASDSKNIITNGSFEQGPWEKSVRDCDAYDADPRIGMVENYQERTKGTRSLTLWAQRHTACIRSADIAVSPGTYLLSFDYKALYADQISYRIIMNGREAKAAMRPVVNNSGGWLKHVEALTIPEGTSSIQIELRGLPPGAFSTDARFTSFDDVRLQTLSVTNLASDEATTPLYQSVHKAALGSTTNIAVQPAGNGENLIQNGSLEDGLWQKKVGDCNNYDDQPKLSMQTSSEASAGKHSLELRASRHIACTSPPAVKVKEGSTYLLRFDYQSPNSKTARYSVSFDDFSKSAQSKNLKATGTWQTHQQVVKVPLGASMMNVRVNAVSDETGNSETINRYDNFSLIEIPDVMNQLYIVEKLSDVHEVVPEKVETVHDSSSKKTFTIQGAQGTFYLSMAEAYHAGWKLQGIADSHHFKAAGFMNGWYVDVLTFCKTNPKSCSKQVDGTYDLKLVATFALQKSAVYGSVASALVLIVAGVYIVRGLHGIGLGRSKDTAPPKFRQIKRSAKERKGQRS